MTKFESEQRGGEDLTYEEGESFLKLRDLLLGKRVGLYKGISTLR